MNAARPVWTGGGAAPERKNSEGRSAQVETSIDEARDDLAEALIAEVGEPRGSLDFDRREQHGGEGQSEERDPVNERLRAAIQHVLDETVRAFSEMKWITWAAPAVANRRKPTVRVRDRPGRSSFRGRSGSMTGWKKNRRRRMHRIDQKQAGRRVEEKGNVAQEQILEPEESLG